MNALLSALRTRPEAILSVGTVLELTGRTLMAAPFLISGLSKLLNYANVGAAMSSAGVPSTLLPLAIASEIFGACALIIGWRTRMVAGLLACFSALAALIFHHDLSDQTQMFMFLKDFAIAGGLLLAVSEGLLVTTSPIPVDLPDKPTTRTRTVWKSIM